MHAKMTVIALAIFMAMCVAPVWAQDDPADTMQILREKLRSDKKLLVAANMELTEAEAKAFWPIYEEYQHELFLLRVRTARLIRDYAQAYRAMTDDKVKALLDELVAIKSLGPKLIESYLPKFRAILPDKKVARYYQIENKIQAVTDYELANEIPLVQ